jgi:hypothetical protein
MLRCEMTEAVKRLHLLICFAFVIAGSAAAQDANALPESGNVVLKEFPVKASQGVAVDAKWFYAISNTRISKHDKRSGEWIADWKADHADKAQSHFKHLNSGTAVGNKLYCAHSRFPLAPNDCTVEVFDIGGKTPKHEATIPMPGNHGSLTWIDQSKDGAWWMCYAIYGKDRNKKTKLVKYSREGGKFIAAQEWYFPGEVVAGWGAMSCSGGSWGADGCLYVTGHDRAEAYVLTIDESEKLSFVRTEKGLGLFGQAIAWDRRSERPVLWGIVKDKLVSQTLVPPK